MSFEENILPTSADMPDGTPQVSGIDFNDFKDRNITVAELLDRSEDTGYQATSLGKAVKIINGMRSWPKVPNPQYHALQNEIFLGFTSNLVSSGLRSTIRYLVEHKHVTCLVATAGGIEEDIIKCLAHTYVSTFHDNDEQLRLDHINRIGNLRVPNNNYVAFEDWITPILRAMLFEQETSFACLHRIHETRVLDQNYEKTRFKARNVDFESEVPIIYTPSMFIARLGKEIDDDSSICTWAYRNNIPIFCPALTDGSIGDMLSQFAIRANNRPYVNPYTYDPKDVRSSLGENHPYFKHQPLIIDIAADIDLLNSRARNCQLYGAKMGAIILGGGLVKHHIMNACLQGGGADAAVYVNTGVELDGSDAGARPEEAVSWGKLKAGAEYVKVWADATLVWPMIVAGTWARVD